MRYITTLFVFLLAACGGEPTIEVNSVTDFENAIDEVKAELPEERAERFDIATQAVMQENLGNALAMAFEGEEPSDAADKLVSEINGKTPSEIIEIAEEIAQERLEELEQQRQDAEEARERLEGVEVEDARLEFNHDLIIEASPHIHIRNQTETPIERIYFQGEYQSPDRPVAWWDGEVYCLPDGGLKVDEERDIRCSFGTMSEPREEHSDGEFTVEVTSIQGPDGSPEIEYEWSEYQQTELDSLRQFITASK